MQLVLLVTGGRGGSDFFQGHLDDHQEIIQFPGILRIEQKFINLLNCDYKLIAKKFTKFAPIFFDSRLNKIERHDKLGKNRDQFYTVDKKKFIKNFNSLITNKKRYSTIDLIEKLHLAYFAARNKNIKKAKILFIHTHTVFLTKKFVNLTKVINFSIIYSMRHPFNALLSPIKNWLNFNNGSSFFSKDLYFQFDLALNGLSDLVDITKKTYIVQLENLIDKKKVVMKDFCKIYKIKYSKSMLNCTYFGKQWWGDQISKRWLGKKTKQNKIKIDDIKKYFYKKDLDFFYNLTKDVIFQYYDEKKIKNRNIKILFSPTKAEILVWFNTLKHLKLKHMLSIPFYYIKRIILLNKYSVKNSIYPYSLGSDKS